VGCAWSVGPGRSSFRSLLDAVAVLQLQVPESRRTHRGGRVVATNLQLMQKRLRVRRLKGGRMGKCEVVRMETSRMGKMMWANGASE